LGAGADVGLDAVLFATPPLAARAAPRGLHLVGDEQAARTARDRHGDLEVLLRRRDEPSDAQDRLRHEGGDLAIRRGLDERLEILRAGDAAIGVLQPEVAAVAVRSVGESDPGHLALRLGAVLLIA